MAAFFVSGSDDDSNPAGGMLSTLRSLGSVALRGTQATACLKSGRHGVFRIGPLTDECHKIAFISRCGRAGKRGVLEWYRMTADALNDCSKRHLAQLAKDKGIGGWHAMRKDQLIKALRVRVRLLVTSRKRMNRQSPRSHAGKNGVGRRQSIKRNRCGCDTDSDTRPRLSKRPNYCPHARFILAACILGIEPYDPGACPCRARSRLARRPADSPRHGCLQRRHDLRRGKTHS